MLFTSYQFIIFLFVVVSLFYIVPKKCQLFVLLLSSYYFYYMASEGIVLYIFITTISTFVIAKKISVIQKNGATKDKIEKKKRKQQQKRWLIFCLCINLGLLGIFKYTNFTIHNINVILYKFDLYTSLEYIDILLPLGISFYTFQSIGYLVDVYRGKYEAEKNPIRFFLFVSFFPQLIQGPISRFDELSKSLFSEKKFKKEALYSGLQRILWGYFKKLVIADRILVAVNTIIRNPEQYQGGYVLLGAIFYAIELYADFTGGIDITIGIGELFGIHIAENFRRPFFSKSVKEYWNRWHISMGTWFRDYIFYPVSISKPMKKITSFCKKQFGVHISKKVTVYLSSFVVWFLTGLWHGASWNFIAWGLGNFFLIMLSEECKPMYELFHKKFPKVKEHIGFQLFQIIRTIFFMSCLRMFDCYRDVSQTIKMFGTIFTKWNSSSGTLSNLGLEVVDFIIIVIGVLLLLIVSMLQMKGSVRLQIKKFSPVTRFVIWYGLFLVVLLFGAYGVGYDETQFIYNQF